MSSDNDRLHEAVRAALKEAETSAAGDLPSIFRRYFPDMDGRGKVKICPGCGEKDKFGVLRAKLGHFTWGCYKNSCRYAFDSLKGDKHGDTVGLIMNREGCSRREAEDKYLSYCGIRNPREDAAEAKRKKKPAAKPTPKPAREPAHAVKPLDDSPAAIATETPPAPSPEAAEETAPAPEPPPKEIYQPPVDFTLSAGPDEEPAPPPPDQPTVWDDLYSRLSLRADDRENLKRKRGLSRETIEAAGYRSSVHDNRAALTPLLSSYPINLLLAEGIAVKDQETGQVKINSQLCGWGLKQRGGHGKEEIWDWTNPILIPYRNRKGQTIGIRPHKGGLSGKRYMREQGFEIGFRSTRTRTRFYTSFLFWDRPMGWEKRCVLTEGEHKANALAQCGIPACAVPGIQMPRNEIFLEEMTTILREAGIREVIIAFDNEDKSHKADPWDRYDVDVYALYSCHALRGAGFLPSHLILPDDWRIDGKADWDGALLQFGGKAKDKFHAAIRKARPYYPQTEIFGTNERERIIHCKLNRLIYTPQILVGGDEEEELAKLILKAPLEWKQQFGIRDLAALLFSIRGCYFVHQKPSKDILCGKKGSPGLYSHAAEIRGDLLATPAEDLETIAGLEAALAACNLLIKGHPKDLSDFTISCEFQVRTQGGEVHRLFRFRNRHGQVSQLIHVPPAAMATSSRFREFCMSVGNFNLKMGDLHLQELMQDLGTFSAWREIRELEMLGRDPESHLWIFGDCAFSPHADLFAEQKQGDDPDVIFADKHDIIWQQGVGFRVDPQDLASFAHGVPPRFFKELGKEPQEVFKEIKTNPEGERCAVAKIFFQFSADLICTFGDSSGLLVLGGLIGWAVAPELLAKYRGHPGIWIHGRMQSGKTETATFMMQTWGYDAAYKTFVLSGGTTQAFIDRAFSQYSDIPAHADEFRQKEADDNRIASLRSPFNRQSKGKAKMEQTNRTRLVNPMTSPIVTGEGVTKDSATLSRYIEAILAADKRLGTKDEQNRRYKRMLGDSRSYHRIIRYVLLNRKWFAREFMVKLEQFIHHPEVSKTIPSDRIRLTYGTAYAAFSVLMDHLIEGRSKAMEAGTWGEFAMVKPDVILLGEHYTNLFEFSTGYALRAAEDVISINFVVKFWKDVVTYMNINQALKRFIWFERCIIDQDTNKVTVASVTYDAPGTVRCVIVRAPEMYAEYQKESRTRGLEPELSLSNIKAELQNGERYWVPAPKHQKRQAHRLTRGELGYLDVWVLRCDRMEPSIESVFSEQFDKNETEQEALSI